MNLQTTAYEVNSKEPLIIARFTTFDEATYFYDDMVKLYPKAEIYIWEVRKCEEVQP